MAGKRFALGALVLLVAVAAACGEDPAPDPAPTPVEGTQPVTTTTATQPPTTTTAAASTGGSAAGDQNGSLGTCPVFPADNAWNTDVSTTPVHANSANYINNILANGGDFLHADFGGGGEYGIPYVTVSGNQPRVPTSFFDWPDESDPGPYPIPLQAPVEHGPQPPADGAAAPVALRLRRQPVHGGVASDPRGAEAVRADRRGQRLELVHHRGGRLAVERRRSRPAQDGARKRVRGRRHRS